MVCRNPGSNDGQQHRIPVPDQRAGEDERLPGGGAVGGLQVLPLHTGKPDPVAMRCLVCLKKGAPDARTEFVRCEYTSNKHDKKS